MSQEQTSEQFQKELEKDNEFFDDTMIVLNRGRRLRIEEMSRERLGGILAEIQWSAAIYLLIWAQASDASRKLPPVVMRFTDRLKFNAFVKYRQGRYFLAVDLGIVMTLYDLSFRAFSCPQLFPDIGDISKEKFGRQIIPLRAVDSASEDDHKLNGEWWIEYMVKHGLRASQLAPHDRVRDEVARIVARLRKVDGDTCEMKRLFVRPACRHSGLGQELAMRAIGAARQMG